MLDLNALFKNLDCELTIRPFDARLEAVIAVYGTPGIKGRGVSSYATEALDRAYDELKQKLEEKP